MRALAHACAGLGLAAALLSACAAAAEPAKQADAERFRASAEVRPMARSADDRFVLEGKARAAPAATSPDGRFVLKAVVPECDAAIPNLVFADGFESR